MNKTKSIHNTNLIIIVALLMNLAAAVWMVRTPHSYPAHAAQTAAAQAPARATEAA